MQCMQYQLLAPVDAFQIWRLALAAAIVWIEWIMLLPIPFVNSKMIPFLRRCPAGSACLDSDFRSTERQHSVDTIFCMVVALSYS